MTGCQAACGAAGLEPLRAGLRKGHSLPSHRPACHLEVVFSLRNPAFSSHSPIVPHQLLALGGGGSHECAPSVAAVLYSPFHNVLEIKADSGCVPHGLPMQHVS